MSLDRARFSLEGRVALVSAGACALATARETLERVFGTLEERTAGG